MGCDRPYLSLLHNDNVLYISLVSCSSLSGPSNGMMNCSLGDDGVPTYEDTCSFTCNTGYELTGSDTRTCQDDGSWSGSDTTCSIGEQLNICLVMHEVDMCTCSAKAFNNYSYEMQ